MNISVSQPARVLIPAGVVLETPNGYWAQFDRLRGQAKEVEAGKGARERLGP